MELDLVLDREGVVLQPSDSTDLLDETVWLQQLEPHRFIKQISAV